jgi:hypothetical protein
MIPDPEMLELAQLLLARTRSDSIEWKSVDLKREDGAAYAVEVGASTVTVQSYTPRAGSDSFSMFIYTRDMDIVGSIKAEPDTGPEKILRDLHNEASRVATGWDRVLQEIKASLEVTETVG